MPQALEKLWSCAGSAGVINPPDAGKIILNNSVAQLGPGLPVITKEQHAEAAAKGPQTQTITAVLRYGVVPVDGVFSDNTSLALRLRYRGGSGHVVAKFIQVNIAAGTETVLIVFDSKLLPNSNNFQTQESENKQPLIDFVANAYYVELTMTVTESIFNPPANPPAVSVVQLASAPPIIQ